MADVCDLYGGPEKTSHGKLHSTFARTTRRANAVLR